MWTGGGQRPGHGGAAAAVAKQYPNAKRYDDWRVMLQEMDKSIDGVVVSSTDHTHAHCVITAMKMGKHVFCEKPLAHSIHETRAMMTAEKKYKRSSAIRLFRAMLPRTAAPWWNGSRTARSGKCARLISTKSSRASRPTDDLKKIQDDVPVPPEVKWDLWIGPAPTRKFNAMYHPNRWRYWIDFGTSKLGDHGPHYIDPIVWALDLGLPETLEANTDAGYDATDRTQKYPALAEVKYGFPARGKQPP